MDWSVPARRYWLCRTVGRNTISSIPEDSKEESGFGTSEQVKGGAATDVLCEIYHEDLMGLAPVRLVRCVGSDMCAILFGRRVDANRGPDFEDTITKIALVSFAEGRSDIHIMKGRDLILFPSSKDDSSVDGLVLNVDGSSLGFFSWNLSSAVETGASCRPIIGFDSDSDEYLDCSRVVLFAEGRKMSLGVVGTRVRDGKPCFLVGDPCDTEMKRDSWSKILPNIVTGRVAWLQKTERILAVLGLEGDGSGYRNFALATTSRVVILSSALTVSAEAPCLVAGSSLAPIGSFVVCFISGNAVRYLCCLDDNLVGNSFSALPKHVKRASKGSLMSICPDRILVYPNSNGVGLVEDGHNQDAFILPTAMTHPALLLEPLVASAVCVGGKRNQPSPVLRAVVEKFGRKLASITHAENEGIGQLGAGMTSRLFEILNRYKLAEVATWLLTGTVKFDRSSNTTILPPWLPVVSKVRGATSSEAILHVLSNGDSYFTEYLKAPSQNTGSNLPRESDPTSYIANEIASAAIRRGDLFEATKIFDVDGSESSDLRVLQLAVMLEKRRIRNSDGLLNAMSGSVGGGMNTSASVPQISASLAAIATSLKTKEAIISEQVKRWIQPMAPSLQRCQTTGRLRHTLFPENEVDEHFGKPLNQTNPLWAAPCNESKHIWYVVTLEFDAAGQKN
jgi:hypothetical protein